MLTAPTTPAPLRPRSAQFLVLLFAGVLAVNICWFAQDEVLRSESPLRIALGAVCLLLLPGWLLGELAGFRTRHPLETIALGFVLSLAIEIVLLPLPFLWAGTISHWLIALLSVTAALLALVAWKWRRSPKPRFLAPLVNLPAGSPATAACSLGLAIVPLLLGAVAYACGEDVMDLGGEKLLHVEFVRRYYSVPLVLTDLGIDRGLPPPNLVNLWEFLLAGWARLTRIDPLPLFFRARCVVPVLGLASMYLLTSLILVRPRRTNAVFLGVLVMCVGGFLLRSSSLGWVTAIDPTRGVLQFMGTAHHADGALDILLALTAGCGLLWFRRPGLGHAVLLLTMLTANFLWHPREFFQYALYVGIFGLLILALPSLRNWVLVRRWAVGVGLMCGAAVCFLCISAALVGKESQGYDEAALKRAAVGYALLPENLLGVRNLFRMPFHFGLTTVLEPERIPPWPELRDKQLLPAWQLDRWLFLSAAGLMALAVWGQRQERRLGVFYFLLWFVALAWNSGMLSILALTYSEFYQSTPRLLYLFAYLVVASAVVVVGRTLLAGFARAARWWHGRSNARLPSLATLTILLAMGTAVGVWQPTPSSSTLRLTTVLSVLAPLSVLAAIAWIDGRSHMSRRPGNLGGAWMILAFLVPVVWQAGHEQWARGAFRPRANVGWFEHGNPFAFSPELIEVLRGLPDGRKILVHPAADDYLSTYAPHYLTISPIQSVIKDLEARRQVAEGEHVLLPPLDLGRIAGRWNDRIDHAAALRWLDETGTELILVDAGQFDGDLPAYFERHAEVYEVVFDQPATKELLVRVVPAGMASRRRPAPR